MIASYPPKHGDTWCGDTRNFGKPLTFGVRRARPPEETGVRLVMGLATIVLFRDRERAP
jgi:hypothetical protein